MKNSESNQKTEEKHAFPVMDEIALENESCLRESKLAFLALEVDIKNYERRIAEEEEKRDPNRGIFHTLNDRLAHSETDRMRKELFEKKARLNELQESMTKLESKKRQLYEVRKALAVSIPQEENDTRKDRFDLRDQLLIAQENERSRIANELHDSSVQNLAALLHRVELVERFWDMDKERALIELIGIKEAIHITIKEIREVIYDLRPMDLTSLGLWMSVKSYLNQLQERYSIQIAFDIEEQLLEVCFDQNQELNIFRMIQESVINSVKHAKATLIRVKLYCENQYLLVSIVDDGEGISESEMNQTNKYGMQILRERAKFLSATMEIQTGKKGTELSFKIPTKQRNQEQETDR